MSLYLSIGEVAAIIGVCTKTLRRWDRADKFKPQFRTIGNHRRYSRRVLNKLIERDNSEKAGLSTARQTPVRRAALYARVSSSRQKKSGDLERQIQTLGAFAKERGLLVQNVYHDVGSGLNDKRRGLLKMLEHGSKGAFDVVLVNYTDRLARFGIEIIKIFFESWGIDLIVKHKVIISEENPNARLVTDLTAILYSFMGKLYRSRRGKNRS